MISTLVDYGIYALCIRMGVVYYVAIVLGYTVGLIVNFSLARRTVFTSGSHFEKTTHEFAAVALVSVLAVGLTIFIVWVLHAVGINYYIGRAVAIVVVFFFNYEMRRRFIYIREES